jgi:hypothetical protein
VFTGSHEITSKVQVQGLRFAKSQDIVSWEELRFMLLNVTESSVTDFLNKHLSTGPDMVHDPIGGLTWDSLEFH